ncbi:MAG: hypothetical protein M3O64_04340 [Chloroflexota bacterium]|nr:hypothetical protein [Chloroflexota bacterium]
MKSSPPARSGAPSEPQLSPCRGDLFLHPQFPESQLLITLLLIGVLLAFTVARSLAPLARASSSSADRA